MLAQAGHAHQVDVEVLPGDDIQSHASRCRASFSTKIRVAPCAVELPQTFAHPFRTERLAGLECQRGGILLQDLTGLADNADRDDALALWRKICLRGCFSGRLRRGRSEERRVGKGERERWK